MSFYARQPLRLLSSSKVATAALAALHVRAFSPETTLGRVGTDQAVSKARLTIDAAWSDKSCCQKYRDLSLAAALHQSRSPPVGSIEPVRVSRPTKTSFTRLGSLIANSRRTSSSTARAGIEVVCRERRLLIGSGPVISALRDVKLARPGRSRKPEFG